MLTLLLLLSVQLYAIPAVAPSVDQLDVKLEEPSAPEKLSWHKKLSSAQTIALNEYKPMLIFFSAKGCQWSIKLEDQVFTDKLVRQALKNFVLVHLDRDDDSNTANKYWVYSVPTLLFVSSDMSIIGRIDGFIDAKRLAEYLNSLTTSNSDVKEQKVNALIRRLEEKKMNDTDWEELLTALGWRLSYRRRLQDAVLGMEKVPLKKLTGFLTHKKLTVRTGAIELLEEYQGDNFGYDPWFEGSPTVKDLEAIAAWRKLAENGKLKKQNTAVLTKERYDILLSRVISNKRDVSARAGFRLKNGGNGALSATQDFIVRHPELTVGQQMKLRELKYAIIFTQLNMERTLSLAHQLVYGNLDTKAKALVYLSQYEADAMEVIKNYLNDPESILRETAVDALVAAGGKKCVKYLEAHLTKEKNADVIFCILKNLGKVKSVNSAKLLLKYLKDPNEDLNIVALQSLIDIKAVRYRGEIVKCLENPRWRIQVAALDAIIKLNLSCPKEIEKLLDSKDEFVRIKAIEALASQKNYNSRKKLDKLYFENDSLKGPVISAYMSMEKPLPESFIKALNGKDVNVLSQVVTNLNVTNRTGFNMAKYLAENSNDDIACQALNLISEAASMPLEERAGFMNKFLEGKSSKRILAVLKNLQLNDKDFNKLKYSLQNKGGTIEKDEVLEELLDAFEENAGENTEKKIEVNELLNAFGGEEKAGNSTASSTDAVPRLIKLHEQLLKQSANKDIAFYCALTMAKLNRPEGIDYLARIFDSQPKEKKEKILYTFERGEIFTDKTRNTARKALSDKNDEIVKCAISFMLHKKNKQGLRDVMLFFENSKKRKIYDYFDYSLEEKMKSRAMMEWAQKILQKEKLDNTTKIFALSVLGQRKNERNRLLLLKFIGSKNIWVRRAAFYSYGSIDFNAFEKAAGKLAGSKDEHIRVLVPVMARKYLNRSYDSKDIIYFDANHSISVDNDDYRQRTQKALGKEFIALLRTLSNDISPRVRFEAFLALMSADQDVDPEKLLMALKRIQDKTAVVKAVSRYVKNNYLFMDKKFKVLMPYVQASEFYGKKYDDIKKYFSSGDAIPLKRTARVEKYKIRSVGKMIGAERKTKVENKNIVLVFFYKNGCSECKTTERYLEIIKKSYPEIIIKTKDISTVTAMRLNETYCDKFDVPGKYRLVAPAVFAGNGYLIKDNISFDKIGQLIADSNEIKDKNWYIADEQDIKNSEKRIEKRYTEIKSAIIFSAGFLDGINPCAFATIVFFISYMLLARRDKKEILQVSIAFISGVFIAYYLMGLGITEVITRLSLVQVMGRWFNWLIMALALVMMILSLYDGILCLKGKIESTKLQLPEFLKERIHRSIREGARKYHFITAAFITGIVISFLELACTGQVYAPTILFMLKTSTGSLHAYYLLLLYNLAFILPLVIIFLLSYLGMKNNTLINVFKKNAALVKFGTALLFLLIFIILLIK